MDFDIPKDDAPGSVARRVTFHEGAFVLLSFDDEGRAISNESISREAARDLILQAQAKAAAPKKEHAELAWLRGELERARPAAAQPPEKSKARERWADANTVEKKLDLLAKHLGFM